MIRITQFFKPNKIFFWLLFSCISLGCAFFSYYFFPRAFPLIHVDLHMDRLEALAQSKEIAVKYHLGPTEAHQAATFYTNHFVKTFIELEGGGKEALIDMMKKNLHTPYTWQVRLFEEYSPHEATISFHPDGTPYGFVEKLSENEPGATLTAKEAQAIAEKHAQEEWHFDLSSYSLLHASQETKPSGRIDHTLVYQRSDEHIGDGFYRVQLCVSGDKFTQLSRFVHVPEAFSLRYQHMRSANNTIARAAQMAIIILYIIAGCCGGIFFLTQRRSLLWKAALYAGIIISLLEFFTSLNQLPLMWTYYDTALDMKNFLIKIVVNDLYAFVYHVCLYILTFIAAEGLTRLAFVSHPQFWSVWSSRAANSYEIVARTVGGYLMVPLMLSYIVLLYTFAQKIFGWWTPSEALINPNILSHYAPWLSSVALSLKAGFWEECLFRAIPLATASLLGKRFGKKNWWILGALIVQAIIFGAAHANYPAQPSYARVIELILPSLLFGFLYLAYGLLPAIITHVIYDVVWFALPLFVSSGTDARINQLIIIICSLIPLLIIIYRYIRSSTLHHLAPSFYNAAWQPAPKTIREEKIVTTKQHTLSPRFVLLLSTATLLGITGWFFFNSFVDKSLALHVTRSQTKDITNSVMSNKFSDISLADWTFVSAVQSSYKTGARMRHRFIWQLDQSLYRRLLGTYLAPSHWYSRYLKFDGPLIDRSEEYRLWTYNNTLLRIKHKLTETTAGAALDQESARLIAQQHVKDFFHEELTSIQEVCAIGSKKPARKDWRFEFSDRKNYTAEKGQARIVVVISGDKVTDSYRYIYLPEEWERSERARQNIATIIQMLCSLFIYCIFACGFGVMLLQPIDKKRFFSIFTKIFLFFFIISITAFIIHWPQTIASFNAIEPFINQLFFYISSSTIMILAKSGLFASTLALATATSPRSFLIRESHSLLAGITVGAIIAAISAILGYIVPAQEPLWANFSWLATTVPFIAPALSWVIYYAFVTSLYCMLNELILYITNNWQQRQCIAFFLTVLFTGAEMGMSAPLDFFPWAITSVALGICIAFLYAKVIHTDSAMIPLILGVTTFLKIAHEALLHGYAYIVIGYGLAGLSVAIFALYLWKERRMS